MFGLHGEDMRIMCGKSFSKTDRVKYEMSYGIDKKQAVRMVNSYWGTIKLANAGKHGMRFV
mgnify:FL=1